MKATFTRSTVLVILLMLLTSCQSAAPQILEGDVLAVQGGTALRGMRLVVDGYHEAFAMNQVGTDYYMFAWNGAKGWMFTLCNTGSQNCAQTIEQVKQIGGNYTTSKTFLDFVKSLEQSGWEKIPATALPAALRQAIIGSASWITAVSSSMTTFVFVPAVVLEPSFLDPYTSIKQ